MRRLRTILSLLGTLFFLAPLTAQDRVVPKAAKGGKTFGEPWAQVPEAYKKIRIPDWPVPTDRKQWDKERLEVRQTLLKCMGDLPKRPDPLA